MKAPSALLFAALLLAAGGGALHFYETHLEGNATLPELERWQSPSAVRDARGDTLVVTATVAEKARAGGNYAFHVADGGTSLKIYVGRDDYDRYDLGDRVALVFHWIEKDRIYGDAWLDPALPRWPYLAAYALAVPAALAAGALRVRDLLRAAAQGRGDGDAERDEETGFGIAGASPATDRP